jgi:hypothetical protein
VFDQVELQVEKFVERHSTLQMQQIWAELRKDLTVEKNLKDSRMLS